MSMRFREAAQVCLQSLRICDVLSLFPLAFPALHPRAAEVEAEAGIFPEEREKGLFGRSAWAVSKHNY